MSDEETNMHQVGLNDFFEICFFHISEKNGAKHSTPGSEFLEKVQFRKSADICVSSYDLGLEIFTNEKICSDSFWRQWIPPEPFIRMIISASEDSETFANITFFLVDFRWKF